VTKDIKNNEHPGYLVTMRSQKMSGLLLQTDGWLGIRMIAVDVNVGNEWQDKWQAKSH